MLETIKYCVLYGLKSSGYILFFMIITLVVGILAGLGKDGITISLIFGGILLLVSNVFLFLLLIFLSMLFLIVKKRKGIIFYIEKKINSYFEGDVDIEEFDRHSKYIFRAGLIILPIASVLWIWGNRI